MQTKCAQTVTNRLDQTEKKFSQVQIDSHNFGFDIFYVNHINQLAEDCPSLWANASPIRVTDKTRVLGCWSELLQDRNSSQFLEGWEHSLFLLVSVLHQLLPMLLLAITASQGY